MVEGGREGGREGVGEGGREGGREREKGRELARSSERVRKRCTAQPGAAACVAKATLPQLNGQWFCVCQCIRSLRQSPASRPL